MSERLLDQSRYAAPNVTLLVELPSWPQNFLANLRDTLKPHELPPLNIRSAPSAFWPDVFVRRSLPWRAFAQSGLVHVLIIALAIVVTRVVALQPHAELASSFQHAQVIYYSPSEYLPPLDTRAVENAGARKPDPELSRQPIISVPPQHESRAQTIVTPPRVRLKQDVALPNIVAWSDTPQKPRLAVPPPPVVAAAEIERLSPRLNPVVTPPPKDVERVASTNHSKVSEPAVIAPPPSVEVASNRPLGELNIGRSAVIAPAPALTVAEQRAFSAGRRPSAAQSASQQVVPPPASLSSAAGGSFGSRGHVVALNLHPAVAAPPDPATGNRRGAFAATPAGHAAATGEAGSSGGSGNGSAGHGAAHPAELPSGLYVGRADSPDPNLAAGSSPLRAARTATALAPENSARLSEPERAVFGNRKFYSLTLNMPNLNSAGGSWIIRFAEIAHPAASADADHQAPVDLSQPVATRKIDPAYPLQLMRQNVAGTVILYAVIHVDGSVGDVRVLRGVDDRLDRFASEAVSKWKFQPATKAGQPVDVEATFRIPFRPAINF